ncbi:hypothetical protein ACFPZ0_20975 [Streptomonospora nanhaiensis]|uniref:Uncharacterized protein n=1 Tax=Streptomonospora nanhaiensis TaxID=1323731 RepID=A0A853BVD2_9ACTN|nr:hypothetical protein [Streptomonospora nanhaiensis]MBV2367162.1 hypothetical protein [Streptomonospora nanhaiensis]MBX9390574.1 hypothetical protein [Streptomonospora nanhaiensis]NYI98182.1 hypothetical protein [Streptomonospora nanhaiensis]
MARPDRPRRADVEIEAGATAEEVTFHGRPSVVPGFTGDPDPESAHGGDRRNLPERVEPGTTYHDVRVDYRIAGRVAEDGGTEDPGADRGGPAERGPAD